MSPVSWPVLGGAAVLSSPALWRALVEGTTPAEVALTRYLVGVVVCWALLAFVATLVGPSKGRSSTDDQGEPAVRDEDPVGAGAP